MASSDRAGGPSRSDAPCLGAGDAPDRERLHDATLSRAFLEMTSDGVFVLDDHGRYVDLNAAAGRLLGQAPEELLGRSFDAFVSDDRRPIVRERFERLKREGTLQSEGEVAAADGRVHLVAVCARAGVRPGRHLVLMRDVTDQRLAERSLAAEHEIGRLLLRATTVEEAARGVLPLLARPLEAAVCALWLVDPDGDRLRCVAVHHELPDGVVDAFVAHTRGLEFGKGHGLPGRVWATGEATAISDLASDPNFPRRSTAPASGLKSGLAVPLHAAEDFLGVIEFFTVRPLDAGPLLLDTLTAVANDVAQFLHRRRAEATVTRLALALSRRGAEIDAIMGALPVGLAVAQDAAAREIRVDARFGEALGVPADSDIGAGSASFRILAEGVELSPEALPVRRAAAEGRIIPGTSLEVLGADGVRRDVLLGAAPIQEEDGRTAGAVGALVDVTRWREAERRAAEVHELLDRLMEHVRKVFLVTEPGLGRVHHVSPSYERVFGTRTEKPLRDARVLLEAVVPEDRPLLERALAEPTGGADVELRMMRGADEASLPRWLRARSHAVRLENGAERVIAVIEDVTELKEAEQRLVATGRELERANADLLQYAYVVSHDLKAPLRAIRQYADFLRLDLGELSGESERDLEMMISAVQQADALVDRLLELSRVGTRPVERQEVVVRHLVEGLLPSLGIPDDVQLAFEGEWPALESDPVLLRQVVQNLLTNAVKFNRSKPRRVTLEGRWVDGGWQLRVRDNGIGIDPRHHEKIFQGFHRLHAASEYAGSGLGLAIVSRAVERLGGRVRLESRPGHGSTFEVTLPAERPRPVS